MSAGSYNIVIEQGVDYSVTLTLKDSGGTLIDLSNYEARMDIREKVGNASAILELEDQSDTTVNGLKLGAGAGTIIITIKSATTLGMDFETAVYDLEIREKTTLVVTRVIEGQVTLDKEVTTATWT